MRFQDLVDAIVDDAALKNAIAELLIIKRGAMESGQGSPMPVINRFLEFHLNRLSQSTPPSMHEGQDFSVLDRLLRDTVLA